MTLVFVANVDAATTRAVELGGSLVDPPTDMPWGLRQSVVTDIEGHVWELSNHQHDVPLTTGEPSRPEPGSSDPQLRRETSEQRLRLPTGRRHTVLFLPTRVGRAAICAG